MSRLPTALVALLAVLAAAAGCTEPGPNEKKPWVLVLAEKPTHRAAARAAERLAERDAAFEGSSALSLRAANGGRRHLLVSAPRAARAGLDALAEKLPGTAGRRLERLDVRRVERLDPERLAIISPPEDCETIERLARLLPRPMDERLVSFLIRADSGGAGGPGGLARSAAAGFSRAFAELGWRATAEATYRAAGAEGRCHVFIGWLAADGDAEAALRASYNFLLARVHPQPAAAADEAAAESTERQRRRKRRRRRRRPQPAPAEPLPLVPVQQPLPERVAGRMPWGESELIALERVGLRVLPPAGRLRRQRLAAPPPPWRARLAAAPGGGAVVLLLFDDEKLVDRLSRPSGLGQPTGLAHSSWLQAIWAALPEVTISGERFAYAAMQRLDDWLPAGLRRRLKLAAAAERPVLQAGYRAAKGRAGWQLNWFRTADAATAGRLFERALVAPRQALIKRVMEAERVVRYEVGLNLRETGDVQAWHLMGARRGRLQELYFQRGREVWLIRARTESSGGLSAGDLLGRVELLAIWDR
jgi:hypothetical protein